MPFIAEAAYIAYQILKASPSQNKGSLYEQAIEKEENALSERLLNDEEAVAA